ADRDRLQRAHGGFDRSRADAWGAVYRARSIIGSEFVRRIARPTTIGGRPSIVPIISGRAWITGVNQYMLDPDDPWPSGYRLPPPPAPPGGGVGGFWGVAGLGSSH